MSLIWQTKIGAGFRGSVTAAYCRLHTRQQQADQQGDQQQGAHASRP
ncbi:hypothetical protein [Psychromonas sp.]